MTVKAPLFELPRSEGEPRRIGDFEFAYLPSPSDVIPLLGPGGMAWEFYRVEYVEHSPVALPRDKFHQDDAPWIAIYAKLAWVEDV